MNRVIEMRIARLEHSIGVQERFIESMQKNNDDTIQWVDEWLEETRELDRMQNLLLKYEEMAERSEYVSGI
jgi:uncharacterized coiled-coil protein SlyX